MGPEVLEDLADAGVVGDDCGQAEGVDRDRGAHRVDGLCRLSGETDGEPGDSAILPLVLRAARASVSSDSITVDFLLDFARRYPDQVSGALRDDFVSAARRISSRSARGELLDGLDDLGLSEINIRR